MRLEPHVNAVGVEAVVALGKEPTRLVLFELRQADGALLRARLRRRVALGGVDEDRERLEHGGVEAAIGQGAGGGGVHVEDELGAALAVPTNVAAAGSEQVPAGVEVEADHENDDEEENDDGAEHDLAAEGVAFVVGMLRQVLPWDRRQGFVARIHDGVLLCASGFSH